MRSAFMSAPGASPATPPIRMDCPGVSGWSRSTSSRCGTWAGPSVRGAVAVVRRAAIADAPDREMCTDTVRTPDEQEIGRAGSPSSPKRSFNGRSIRHADHSQIRQVLELVIEAAQCGPMPAAQLWERLVGLWRSDAAERFASVTWHPAGHPHDLSRRSRSARPVGRRHQVECTSRGRPHPVMTRALSWIPTSRGT